MTISCFHIFSQSYIAIFFSLLVSFLFSFSMYLVCCCCCCVVVVGGGGGAVVMFIPTYFYFKGFIQEEGEGTSTLLSILHPFG